MRYGSRRFSTAALLLVGAALAGCGRSGDKPATQVAARVNTDEITVSQINYLLARTPEVTAQNAEQAKRAILARLVDQQLARQQAVKDKLDRSPQVLQSLEFAKTEVLAQAYVDKIAAAQPKPTDAEVKEYYAKNPALFAQRRIFSLDNVSFTADEKLAEPLRAETAKARSMKALTDWLTAQGVKYAEQRVIRPAEQVPLELLPRIQAMKDGQIEVLNAAAGHYDVTQLVASKDAPVDEATAAPRIRQFIFNTRAREAVAADMKRLKDGAKIEYVGAFSGVPEKAAIETPASAPPGKSPDQELNKGVQGLFK